MGVVANLIRTSLQRRGVLMMRPFGRYDAERQKLERLRDRGITIRSAIDAGAAEGKWTQMFKAVFPAARVLCVDPRNDVERALSNCKRVLRGVEIAKVALGSKEGNCELNLHSDQTSMLNNSEGKAFGERAQVRMTTLDSLVREIDFPSPDYIKMDLQGAELAALDGSEACLQSAQAVQLELNWLPFQAGMPLVADVVEYMKKRHFAWYDILHFCHRPMDGAFAQADALFLKEGHPLRASGKWDSGSAFS